MKIFNKNKARLSNVHADENQNYRDGVKYQFGISVKRDHDKALECYKKGALEDDYLSTQKVKNSKLDQKTMIFNIAVILLSITVGLILNVVWISMVIIGTVISITSIIGIQHYWHRKSFAYIFNWAAFFTSTILIIPVSTIIPYFNGVTWIPITLMFTIGFFVFFGGILLFISDKEKYNIVVFACGLFILLLTIGALSFETPGKKFIVRDVEGGVEIAAYRSSDPDVVIPTKINNKNVISIGPSAFYGEPITSVIIKDNILEIKDYAFAYTRSLEYIKLPDTVLLSEGVFYGASGLTSVELPDNMPLIPDELFFGATKLESIDLPNTITSIGEQAFAYNYALLEIDIPDGVLSIGAAAFLANNFTSIEIPDSVSTIGSYAFANSPHLSDVVLSANMSHISDNLFQNNYSLTSFVVPDNIMFIGNEAFLGNINLETIELHDQITFIGDSAFKDNYELNNVVIPDSITSLSPHLFQNARSLTNITLPDNLTSIGDRVFSGTINLEAIELPEGLTHIGSHAFEHNYSLLEIDLPNSLTSLGSGAFHENISLTELHIPNLVKVIRPDLCYGCENLEVVTFADDITEIGSHAFYRNLKLTAVDIPGTVTTIGEYAFYGNPLLETVILNEGLLEINAYAFYGNSSLSSIDLPLSLLKIEDGVFGACSQLSTIYIRNNVSFIGHYAFYGCTNLTVYLEADEIPETWISSWNPDDLDIVLSHDEG